MKNAGEGIAEILESGQMPSCTVPRIPQAWSSWKNAKATARQNAQAKHRGAPAFSIKTEHSRDMKAVDISQLSRR